MKKRFLRCLAVFLLLLLAETAWAASPPPSVSKYRVLFRGNGAAMADYEKLLPHGKTVLLPANRFKRAGYAFTGWNTERDGSGIACANKGKVRDLTETDTVTLYAQ